MYYLYILHSPSADRFYVGITNNPMRRIFEHNHKPANTFTAKYRPWQMVALFECTDSLNIAKKTESLINKQKSRKFILQLINPNSELIQQLKHLINPQKMLPVR